MLKYCRLKCERGKMKIIKYFSSLFFITLIFTGCITKISSINYENYTNPLIKDKNIEKLKFEDDKLDCEIIAYDKVPDSHYGNSSSGSFTTTNTSTGITYRGNYSNSDVGTVVFQNVNNSKIRLKYFEQCMRDKGWKKLID